jgi:hypothetical protein
MPDEKGKPLPGEWWGQNQKPHWYIIGKNTHGLIVYQDRMGLLYVDKTGGWNTIGEHLPDCTGWDWQPPKPEKKYRPFANAAEFMPHRGRWIYFCDDFTNQLLPNSFKDRGIWHAQRFTDWGEMFSQAKFADDKAPFGVEVTK